MTASDAIDPGGFARPPRGSVRSSRRRLSGTALRRAAVCWAWCLCSAIPFAAGRAPAAEPEPGDAVFGPGTVVHLHLTMTPEAYAALTPAPRAPGFPPPPPGAAGDAHRNTFGVDLPWSRGDVEVDGRRFTDVGVRCKGNYTFLATARSLRKSLKIDFNRHVAGQKLDGLSMVNLHCGVSDPSRAREPLSLAFFRDAGVPAPRSAIAELTLTVPGRHDAEFVGAYTLVEQVNKAFLRRWFGSADGLLLKPEGLAGGPVHLGPDWAPYAARYRPENDPPAAQRQRLIDFTALVSRADDAAFAAGIDSFLDVDAFLRFIAANALLANLDSYLGYGHNYYLYLVPATDRFVFIPWDLDLSLATWPAAGTPDQLVELSLDHPHAGADTLLDRLLALPARQARYREIVGELVATSFTADRLLAHLTALEAGFREPLALEAWAVLLRGEGGGNGMPGNGQFGQSLPPRDFIRRRLAAVHDQRAGRTTGFVPRPVGFGPPRR